MPDLRKMIRSEAKRFTKTLKDTIKRLRKGGLSWELTAKKVHRRKADVISAVQPTPKSQYWRDVRDYKERHNLTTRQARAKLKVSEIYAVRRSAKTGKELMRYADLWGYIRGARMSQKNAENYIKKKEKELVLWSP